MDNKEKQTWLTPKKETFLHIINIIILISLCIAIYAHGKDLSCDQCRINFGSKTASEMMRQDDVVANNFSVAILDLYDYYQDGGKCLVFWDRTNGYMKNG